MNSNPALESILNDVDTRVGKELTEAGLMVERNGKYRPLRMGVCHTFWGRKKQILNEEYGINWQSPADLNPNTFYD